MIEEPAKDPCTARNAICLDEVPNDIPFESTFLGESDNQNEFATLILQLFLDTFKTSLQQECYDTLL